MSNMNKQPQTCYVQCDNSIATSDDVYVAFGNKEKLFIEKLESVFIHTPEELEALLQKERREAAEKALVYATETDKTDEQTYDQFWNQYLDQHYPLPKPINR